LSLANSSSSSERNGVAVVEFKFASLFGEGVWQVFDAFQGTRGGLSENSLKLPAPTSNSLTDAVVQVGCEYAVPRVATILSAPRCNDSPSIVPSASKVPSGLSKILESSVIDVIASKPPPPDAMGGGGLLAVDGGTGNGLVRLGDASIGPVVLGRAV
jgi:hypothetical protein